MNKVISFSVWGADPKYLHGCEQNIIIAKKIYAGWQTRFYCAQDVPESTVAHLADMGAEIINMQYIQSAWEGLFWRFLPASDSDVDIFISRDIDSRLNEREYVAVEEWLASNKDIHCMRDHIEHNVPMLGGMWGCRNHALQDMKNWSDFWHNKNYKGCDQDFLRTVVFEPFIDDVLCHDRFHSGLAVEGGVQRQPYNRELYNYEYASGRKPDYHYLPIEFFGEHEIRPFPSHATMNYGYHVGEIIG